MNKNKIKQYSLMALGAAVVIPTGCKKDDEVVDDPTIDVVAVNKTIAGTGFVYDYFIVDVNGVSIECDMSLSSPGTYGDYAYMDLDGDSHFQDDNYIDVGGDSYDFLRILNKGDQVQTTATLWDENNDDGYLFLTYNGDTETGIKGQGDKYVGFRTEVSGDFYYGWMKLNLSSDGNTFKLISVGLKNVAGEAIAAGAE